MTDLELLICVLAVIYGFECAIWLQRGSVGFRSWSGQGWRVVHPGSLLGNQAGGVVFAHPLPPLGLVLVGNQFPLSLSPEACLAYVPISVHPNGRPPQSGKLYLWADTKSVEARGKRIHINGQCFLKTRSATYAAWLALHLDQLRRLPQGQREGAIGDLVRATFDTRAAGRKWREFRAQGVKLRVLTNSLFCYLFLLVPATIWHFEFRQCWLPLLLGLLALTTSTALLFRQAFKRLYPSAVEELFTHFLTILLSPATAVRAHDLLARPLMEVFHPLAVAQVLLQEGHFGDLAGWLLREARYPALPLCPRDEAAARTTERHWRALQCRAILTFLKDNEIDPSTMESPPQRLDASCQSFCPRCLAQFTTTEGSCSDCGGLPLAAFSGIKTPTTRKSEGESLAS